MAREDGGDRMLIANLMMPPEYSISSPLRGRASLMSNAATRDAAAMNRVSSANILPGQALEQELVSGRAWQHPGRNKFMARTVSHNRRRSREGRC